MARISVNNDYFKTIDSEDKAYFLGFLMADGCVAKSGVNVFGETVFSTITLNLSSKDKDILEKFKKAVGSGHKIYNGKKFNNCALRFVSLQMATDLAKYGVVPQKTGTESLILDDIDPIYYRHIIRGLIDGDGWISFGYSNALGKDISSIGICGSYDICDFVQSHFYDMLGTNPLKVSKVKDKNCYKIGYTSISDQKKIAKYLYEGSSVYLDRKYELAKQLF